MLGYDRDSDLHLGNRDVHYRLFYDRAGKPCVICMQDFDYYDLDQNRLLSNAAFDTEQEAEDALRLLLLDAAAILGVLPEALTFRSR